MKNNQVRLLKTELFDKATIVFHFNFSREIKKYLSAEKFYIRYDKPVANIDNSVLTIPFISGLLTTSWLSGADILVDTLDENYFNSLIQTKKIFNKFYPEIGFNSDIIVNELVDNKFEEKEMGILFSGGLDSTSLYIQNRDRKPTLFMLLGGVVPIHNKPMIKKLKKLYSRFAEKEGIRIHFIETDIRNLLNESLLTAKYGKYLRARARVHGTWWEGVNHGIIQLCFTAPLTYKKINILKIATARDLSPNGSGLNLIRTLRWGNVRVVPDGFQHIRNEKVKQVLKPYVKHNDVFPKLQCCNYAPVVSEQLNCGSCHKCIRMILELILEGVDPRKCGFPIINNFFENTRDKVLNEINSSEKWVPIQKDIKSKPNSALPCDFVSWFKEFDFTKIKPQSKLNLGVKCIFLYIYSKLPHEVQKRVITKLYYYHHVKKLEQIKYVPPIQ